MADVEVQLLEQEKLIEQLKSMIRERDDAFTQKEKELQDVSAKLSKLKLQAKAKVAKEAKEAKEAKGGKSDSAKKDKDGTAEKEKGTNETEEEGTSRAKSLLFKKKLADKDRVIKEKDEEIQTKEQNLVVKEKIIAEWEEVIQSLTSQLKDKTALMEEYQQSRGPSGDSTEIEERLNHMYDQIVYKDKNLLELNNKILEQERKMIDIQELVGEKNEVIRGRDKVIELLQTTIKEKDQSVTDQSMLISKLTAKVEANDETMGHLLEQVQRAEHSLKHERERFDLRLTESQKYFEETLLEQEESAAKLRKALQDKETELLVSENDLRELLTRHERDIQNIMSKGDVNIQDQVVKMLELKLKETNEVLDGKIKVIENLQKESSQKDKELAESQEIQKSFKEKMQVMSEQMMLFQSNIADMESQWQEERTKYETKIKDLTEKHESEVTEKELKIQNLASTVSQLEAAYSQSSVQYNTLQDRYHNLLKPGGAMDVTKDTTLEEVSDSAGSDQNQNAVVRDLTDKVTKLESVLKGKEQGSEEIECLKQKIDSLTLILAEKEREISEMKGNVEGTDGEHVAELKSVEEDSSKISDSAEDVVVLKNKLTELEEEKGSLQLKLVDFEEAKRLQGELESQLADLRNTIERLESEKAVLDQSLSSCCEEKDELQKMVDDLQGDLDKTQEALQHVQSEVKSDKDLIGQLQSEKVCLEVKAAEVEEQKEVAEKEKTQLQTMLDSLRNRMESEMQQPLIDIERERDELKLKVASLEEDAANQTHINKELKDQLNSATAQLSDKDTELENLQSELASKTNELEAQLKQNQELSLSKEDNLVQIQDLQQQILTLRDESTKAAEKQLNSSEENQSVREKDQQLRQDTQSELENTKRELIEAKAVLDKQDNELNDMKNKLSVVNENITEIREKYEECQSCVQRQTEEVNDFLSVFNVTDLTLIGAKDLVHTLKKEIERDKQNITDLETKISGLKQDIVLTETSYKDKVLDLTQGINLKQKEIEKISGESGDLKRKLDSARLDANQLKREMDTFKEGQTLNGDELESKMHNLLSQINDSEKLLCEKSNIIQEQSKQIEIIKCEAQEVAEENKTYKSELLLLKTACDEKDKTLTDLNNSYSRVEEMFRQLETECHNLNTEVGERDTKIHDLVTNVEALEYNLRGEEQRLQYLSTQKDIIESENHVMKEEIVRKDSLTANLLHRLNEESQRRLSEEEQVTYLKTSNEETLNSLKSLELEAEHVKSDLETTRLDLDRIKKLCSEKDTTVYELTQTVETITSENQRLEVCSSEALEKLTLTETSLQEVVEKLKAAEETLLVVQAENERLQTQMQIKDQTDLIADNKVTIQSLEKQRDEILEQLNVRQTDYDTILSQYQSLEESNQNLRLKREVTELEMGKLKEALANESQLVQSLEQTVQDTKNQLKEALAEKEISDLKTASLIDEHAQFCDENERQKSVQENAVHESEEMSLHSQAIQNVLQSKNELADSNTAQEAQEQDISTVETLNDMIVVQSQQIQALEQELASLKETQMPAIEWDDYDLRDICNRLEKEKQDLTAEVSNQNKLMKKKDAQIKTLSRQLDALNTKMEEKPEKDDNNEGLVASDSEILDIAPIDHMESMENKPSEVESFITPINTSSLTSMVVKESETQELQLDETDLDALKQKLFKVTQERDKYKADNKKLLKVGKGKDTKVNLMNKNFEKLRQERDALLAERDTLENELQDINSKSSNFDSSYDKEVINNLMMRCKELEALCEEKQIENLRPGMQNISQSGDSSQPVVVLDNVTVSTSNKLEQGQDTAQIASLSKPDSKLKGEVIKLQKINKGKEAKIRKLEEKLSVQENETKNLKEILAQKDEDMSISVEDRAAFEKMNEIKIILEFELQCAKEELAKVKHSQSLNGETTDKERQLVTGKDDTSEQLDISEFSEEIVRSKVIAVLQENKRLKQENNKLLKLSKGKEAKVKKAEDLITQQQKVISDKDTDILILKESVKDLTSKFEALDEDEHDLRYRLENALIDRDEWYDQCQDLEDQLDAAHESIDMKNEELLRLDEAADVDRETIDNLMYERDSLEREVESLKNELELLQNSVDKKDEEIKKLETKLEETTEQKEKLTSDIKKLNLVKKGKEAKAKKLEESMIVQGSAIEANEEYITGLENKMKEAQSHLHAFKQENERLRSQMQSLELYKDDLENEIGKLNSKLNDQNQQIKHLHEVNEAHYENFESQTSRMVEEIQNQEMSTSDLKQQLHITANQSIEFEKKLVESEQTVQHMNILLVEKEKSISDIKKKLLDCDQEIQANLAALLSTQEKVKDLMAQIDEKDKYITDLLEKIEAQEKAAEQSKWEIHNLQGQFNNLSIVNQELEQIIQTKTEALGSTTARCDALKAQFDSNIALLQEKDNEVSALRKKYLALDQDSIMKQSLIEEKEKHLTNMSEEEILKLQNVVEEKNNSLNVFTAENHNLHLENKDMKQTIEKLSIANEHAKQQWLSEKYDLEQNLNWYIQYHETSAAEMKTLLLEKECIETKLQESNIRLNELSEGLKISEDSMQKLTEEKEEYEEKFQLLEAKLTENTETLRNREESVQKMLSEQVEIVHELQAKNSQLLEKLNLYENESSKRKAYETNLVEEFENLRNLYEDTETKLKDAEEFSQKTNFEKDQLLMQYNQALEKATMLENESNRKETSEHELRQEIGSLKFQNQSISGRLNECEEELKKTLDLVQNINTEKAELQSKLNQSLEDCKASLNSEENLQKMLTEKEQLLNEWYSRCCQAQESVNTYEKDLNTARSHIDSLNQEVESIRNQYQEVEEKLKYAEASNRKYSTDIQELQTNYSQAHEKLSQHGSEVNERNNIVDKLNDEISLLKSENENMHTNIERYSAELKDSEDIIQNGYLEREKLQTNIQMYENNLTERNNITDKLREENTYLQSQNQSMKGQIEEYSVKLRETEESLQTALSEKEMLQISLKELHDKSEIFENTLKEKSYHEDNLLKEIEVLRSQYQDANARMVEYSESLRNASESNDIILKEKEDLKSNHKETLTKFEHCENELRNKTIYQEQLLNDIETLRHQCHDLNSKLLESSEKLQKAQESGLVFVKENEKKIAEIQAQYSQALEKQVVLENECKSKSDHVNELLKELDSLRTQYQQLALQQEKEISEKESHIKLESKVHTQSLPIIVSDTQDLDNVHVPVHEEMVQTHAAVAESSYTKGEDSESAKVWDKEDNLGNEMTMEVKKLKKLCKGKDARIKKLEEKLKAASETSLTKTATSEKEGETNILSIDFQQVESSPKDLHEKEKLLLEIENLSGHVSSMQTRIDSLLNDKTESSELENTMKNQITELQTYSESIANELQAYKDANDQWQSYVSKLQTDHNENMRQSQSIVDTLTAQLNEYSNQISALSQSNEECNEKLKSVLKDKEESLSLTSLKDDELRDLKDIMKQQMTEIQDLKKKLQLGEQTGEGLQSEKERFEEILKSEREEIQSLYEQMNELVSEKLDLESAVQAKEQDLKAAKETLEVLAAERENWEKLKSDKEELQLEVETLSRDISTLRERIGEKDSEREELVNNLNQKETTLDDIWKQLQKFESEKMLMEEKLKNANNELLLTQDNAEALAQELETKKEAATKLKDMCFEKDQLVESLKETIQTMSDESQSLKQQKDQVCDELVLYKQQYHEVNKKSHDNEAKLNKLSKTCKQLEESVYEKTNSLISKAEEIGALRRQITSLEETLEHIKQQAPAELQKNQVKEEMVNLQTVAVHGAVQSAVMEQGQGHSMLNVSSMESQILTAEAVAPLAMQTHTDTGFITQAAELEYNTEINTLREKTIQKDEEIERLNAMIGLKTESYNSLDTKLKEKDEKISSLIKSMQENDLTEALAEVKGKALLQEEEIERLNKMIGLKAESYNTLDRKLHEKDEKIAFLLENMQEMEERLSQLSNEEDSESMQFQIQKREEELQHLKKTVEEKDLKFAKALATAKKLKQQLNQTNSALEKEKADKEALEKQLIATKEEVEQLQHAHHAEAALLQETEKTQKSNSPNEQNEADVQVANLQSQLQTYVEYSQQLQGQVQSLTEQVHSSESQLNQLEDQIKNMGWEKQALEQILVEKEEFLKEDRTEIDNLKSSLKEEQTMLEEKDKMNSLLQQELKTMVKAHKEAEEKQAGEVSELNEKIEHLHSTISELENKKDELTGMIALNETTVNEKMTIIMEKEQQCSELQDTIQLLQSELKVSAEETAALKQAVENAKSEDVRGQEELIEFKLKVDELENKLKLETEQSEMKAKILEEFDFKLKQLGKENSSLNMHISQKESDFTNSLASKDSQIKIISAEINNAQKQLQDLQNYVVKLNADKEEMEQNLKSLNKIVDENKVENETLSSLLQEKDNVIQTLIDTRDKLTLEAKALEDSKICLEQTEKQLHENVELLNLEKSNLKALQDQLNEQQNVVCRKDEEIQLLIEEKEDLNQKLVESKANLVALSSGMNEINDIKCQLEKEIKTLECEVESLKQNLSESRQEVDEKCAEIKTNLLVIESLKVQLADFESWKEKEELNINSKESDFKLKLDSTQRDIETHIEHEAELKQKLETVLKEKEDLNEEKVKIVEDLNFSVTEIEDLNEKLKSVTEMKGQLDKELQEKLSSERLFNDRLTDLTHKVIELNEKNIELKGITESKALENTELMNELDSLKNVITETQVSLTTIYSEHDLQKKEYETLMTEFEALKGSLNSSLEANKMLQEELELLKSEKEKHIESVIENVIPVESSHLQGQPETGIVSEQMQAESIEPLQATLSIEISESEQLRQELDELKQTFLDLSQENKDTTQKLVASEAKSEKMLKKLRSFKEKNDALTAEINSLKEEIASAGSVISINKKQKEDLSSQIHVWQERHTNEEGNHYKTKQENHSLKTEIDNKNAEIQRLNSELTSLSGVYQQEKHDLEMAKNGLEESLKVLKSQHDELNNKNKDVIGEVENLKSSLSSSEKLKEEFKVKCEDSSTQISTLETQVTDYSRQLSDLKKENQSLMDKCSDNSVIQVDLLRKEEASQRQLIDMKEQYQMLEQDNRNFQDLIQKMSATNTELKQDNVKQKMMIEKMQDETKNIEEDKQAAKKLQVTLNELETEKENIEEEMEGLRNDVLLLKKQNSTINEEAKALRIELNNVKSEKELLNQTVDGLNWKIEELKSFEFETEKLKRSSDTLSKDKKDLENEIEKLTNQLQDLDSNNKDLQKTVMSLNEKETSLMEEIEKLNKTKKEMESLKSELAEHKTEAEKIKSEKTALSNLVEYEKQASASLKKQLDKSSKKLQALDLLKDEYDFLNNEYNKLLADNSGLSKQVEELLSKLKESTSARENGDLDQAHKEHFDRAKSALNTRVEHLENQCQELRAKNSELAEKEAKLLHDLQEVEFERDRLKSKGEVPRVEDKINETEKLHQQFKVVMEQKNKIQMDLNMAQRSLNQREARCQQLAMQVSQLAEDRSYLNVQMAALSKSLREKEQESAGQAQQYRTLYQAYVTLKATIVELERQTVTDMMYGTPTTPSVSTPGMSTPTTSRGHSPAIGAAAYRSRQDSTDSAPRTRKLSSQELEQIIKLTQQEQMLHEQDMSAFRLGHGEKEEHSKVKVKPVFTRRGRGYLDRLSRLMSLQRSVPPVEEPK